VDLPLAGAGVLGDLGGPALGRPTPGSASTADRGRGVGRSPTARAPGDGRRAMPDGGPSERAGGGVVRHLAPGRCRPHRSVASAALRRSRRRRSRRLGGRGRQGAARPRAGPPPRGTLSSGARPTLAPTADLRGRRLRAPPAGQLAIRGRGRPGRHPRARRPAQGAGALPASDAERTRSLEAPASGSVRALDVRHRAG